MTRPDCIKCKHFYITWDKDKPKGCKAYKIKSQQMPSLIVASSTHQGVCLGFEIKENKKDKDPYT